MSFDASRSTIEFYNCINTMTRRQVRTFRELFSLCSFPPFFFFFFFFFLFFFIYPERENDDAKGARKRRHFLVARFTASKYRREGERERGASRSFPVWIAGKSTVTPTRVSPYLFCRPFLPPADRSRARTRLIFKVPDERKQSLAFQARALDFATSGDYWFFPIASSRRLPSYFQAI